MKSKVYLISFLTLLVGLLTISCDNENEKELITLMTEKETIHFSSKGGSEIIKVTTNDPKWSVSTSDSWIKVSRIDDKIEISVEENKETSSRKGTIEVVSSAPKVSIKVEQEAAKAVLYSLSLDDVKPLAEESKIINVLEPITEKPIAQICHEWIVSGEHMRQVYVLYQYKDGKIDYTSGLIFENQGTVKWDLQKNTCVWEEFEKGKLDKTTFFDQTHKILESLPEGVETKKAILSPSLLIDKRGEEEERYSLVKIGSQIWMAENLRTLRYKDGTPIRQFEKKADWESAQEGAVTYYDKKQEYLKTYGALYNWYATNDSRGLAPDGYAVPTDKEWATMVYYIYPKAYGLLSEEYPPRESEEVAPMLKAKTSWLESAGHEATSFIGFNALAGGSTSKSKWMDYSGMGKQAYFWTSTQYEDKTAIFRRLYYDENFINRWYEEKIYGYSIRCIKK